MSVDFSKEPIGKPRWCITRSGEIRLAWNCQDDLKYPIVSLVSHGGQFETHMLDGRTKDGEEQDDDLVSFAPPECDSFLWKAPELIKVGDWVRVIDGMDFPVMQSELQVGYEFKIAEIHENWLIPENNNGIAVHKDKVRRLNQVRIHGVNYMTGGLEE